MIPFRKTLTATLLATGFAIGLAQTVGAQCVVLPFPINWLAQQEAPNVVAAPPPHGGHTIAQHVGKTDPQMINRVLNGGVNADGSYPNAVAAQGTITGALTIDAVNVNNWCANANVGATGNFDYANAATIGRVAYRPGPGQPPVVVNTCVFRVAMRALAGNTCYLLTSFPKPPVPADNCPP